MLFQPLAMRARTNNNSASPVGTSVTKPDAMTGLEFAAIAGENCAMFMICGISVSLLSHLPVSKTSAPRDYATSK